MNRRTIVLAGILIVFIVSLAVFLLAGARDKSSTALMLFFVIVCGGFAGLIGVIIFSWRIGGFFAGELWSLFYWSSGNVRDLPPEFSKIRAKIANGEYSDAEAELNCILEKDNGNPFVIAILAELFFDKLHDLKKTEGLLKSYLSKEGRNPGDLKFAMMLSDVYLESGRTDLAIDFLKSELDKGYNPQLIGKLNKRISAIENR